MHYDSKKIISEVIKTLSDDDKALLRMAHNHGVAQYVKLPDSRFIGVNLNGVRHLTIEHDYNDWQFGKINYS